jgi:hypothetical protein
MSVLLKVLASFAFFVEGENVNFVEHEKSLKDFLIIHKVFLVPKNSDDETFV